MAASFRGSSDFVTRSFPCRASTTTGLGTNGREEARHVVGSLKQEIG